MEKFLTGISWRQRELFLNIVINENNSWHSYPLMEVDARLVGTLSLILFCHFVFFFLINCQPEFALVSYRFSLWMVLFDTCQKSHSSDQKGGNEEITRLYLNFFSVHQS